MRNIWSEFWNKHPFSKDMVWGLTEFVVIFVIAKFTVTGIHEWLHLWATQVLGGNGYIINTIFGAGVVWTIRPEYPQLVAFAGGVGVAILFGIRIIMDLHDDITEAAALMPLFCSQLAYGIIEGFYILNVSSKVFEGYAQKALTVGGVIGILTTMVMLLYWLVRLSNKHSIKR